MMSRNSFGKKKGVHHYTESLTKMFCYLDDSDDQPFGIENKYESVTMNLHLPAILHVQVTSKSWFTR